MPSDTTIVYHLGAPHTDDDLLIWSLRKDAAMLAEQSVMVPRPKAYRAAMSALLRKLDGAVPSDKQQKELLTSITGRHKIKRLILSNSKFMGIPAWILHKSEFYGNAGTNIARLRNLFPANPCELFLGISNPAVFVPRVFHEQTQKTYADFFGRVDLGKIRWSDVIQRIRAACPDTPMTVWCNEDTPIIWARVLQEVTALSKDTRFSGELDIIERIMAPEGFQRLKKFLDKHPGLDDGQRGRVKERFLEKFVLPEEVEEEIDLPGWTKDVIEAMTGVYDQDVKTIRQIDGVKFLVP